MIVVEFARRRGVCGVLCLAVLAALTACGSGSSIGSGVNSSVGTSSGVAITSETGGSTLLAGETLNLAASVSGTTAEVSAGVVWSLDGIGTLTNPTTTSVTYSAPANLVGTSTPILTATSATNASLVATVPLVVNGKPVIDPSPLFPANVNTPYSGTVIASGGKEPYTWTLSGGTLPAGITLGGSTGFFETLNGTPTAAGTYPLTLTVTDANSATASASLSLVVNAEASCIIGGRYVALVSGISSGSPATRIAAVNIDSAGTMTGIADRKTSSATNAAESVSGNCVNRVANSGELKLTISSESPTYNFSVKGDLAEGRLQLTNGGESQSASGHLYRQTASAFTQASIAGSYAFGVLGVENTDRRHGVIGQFTVSATGVVTAGRADSNAAAPLNAAAFTGTMGAPDANGRGTLTLSGSGLSYSFAYYVIDANRLLLISIDSGATGARLTGFATRRSATFNASALTGAGIVSMWGAATGVPQPTTIVSAGRLSGGNAATGAISLVLDTANRSSELYAQTSTSASYNVESDGRATVNATIAGAARTFTLYLSGANNGYLIERGTTNAASGLLEAQAAGPFNRSLPGNWVAGTQFPQSTSPLALVPSSYISSGSISSSSSSGYAAIDTTTGRGIGAMSVNGGQAGNIAFYIVNANRAILLHYGSTASNATIDWYVN